MKSFDTKYGQLKGIITCSLYNNNVLKDCMLNEEVELNTPFGKLVPQYDYAGVRKKYTNSLAFFPNGELKSISLNTQTNINTPIGSLPAELITFYENGAINRLFPLNGKLSAYWEEEEEYSLAKDIEFNFSFDNFKAKVMGIYFYENGALKGLTFWPNEIIELNTPIGKQKVRSGISLYPDGALNSFEPAYPVDITTPIGQVKTYDTASSDFYNNSHSVMLNEDGTLKSLINSSNKITITDNIEKKHIYMPLYKANIYEDNEFYYEPYKIEFFDGKVRFMEKDVYEINNCSFKIEASLIPDSNRCNSGCSDCSNCSLKIKL